MKQHTRRGVTPTIETARAVGMDADNRNMRAAGRKVWNEDDSNAASAAYGVVANLANDQSE